MVMRHALHSIKDQLLQVKKDRRDRHGEIATQSGSNKDDLILNKYLVKNNLWEGPTVNETSAKVCPIPNASAVTRILRKKCVYAIRSLLSTLTEKY